MDKKTTIIAPFDGSPAAKAGIQPGDKILKINGEEALGLTVQEAVDIIRGPSGTPVILRVEHTDGTTEDIEIIRFLEMGEKIKMVMLDSQSHAVDFPEDIEIVEKMMSKLNYD